MKFQLADICWLDVGDDDWNTTILPVAEWPPEFFR